MFIVDWLFSLTKTTMPMTMMTATAVAMAKEIETEMEIAVPTMTAFTLELFFRIGLDTATKGRDMGFKNVI